VTHDDSKIKQLLEKIRKLKAKADDESTTEAESLAFAAKVAELLAQHGLEESQLRVEDQEQTSHQAAVMRNWDASPARRTMAWAACRLYMVYAIRHTAPKGQWTLIGKKHNITMTIDMVKYLVDAVIRLSREYKRGNPGANEIDFRRGAFVRVAERLEELRKQQTQAAQPAYTPQGNPGNLPALYLNERQLGASYAANVLHINVVSGKGRGIKQGWDAAAGRAAGDSISLNRQVGGGSSRHLIGKS
jgi:uncharacterized protein DUF2786